VKQELRGKEQKNRIQPQQQQQEEEEREQHKNDVGQGPAGKKLGQGGVGAAIGEGGSEVVYEGGTAIAISPAAAAAVAAVGRKPSTHSQLSEAREGGGVDNSAPHQQQGATGQHGQVGTSPQLMDAVSSVEPAIANGLSQHGKGERSVGPEYCTALERGPGVMEDEGQGTSQVTSHAALGRSEALLVAKVGKAGQLPELLPSVEEDRLEDAAPWLLVLLDVVEEGNGAKLQLLKRMRALLKGIAGQGDLQLARDKGTFFANYRELQQAVACKDMDAVKRALKTIVGY
jgi:hypothetical protein